MLAKRGGILRSFGYAFAGISYVIRTQRNMQIHMATASLVVMAGYLFELSMPEWLSIIFAIFLVLFSEIINTAIEAAVDLTTAEVHPLACVAKDCAAAAVLLAAVNSLIIGFLVFWPRLSSRMFE